MEKSSLLTRPPPRGMEDSTPHRDVVPGMHRLLITNVATDHKQQVVCNEDPREEHAVISDSNNALDVAGPDAACVAPPPPTKHAGTISIEQDSVLGEAVGDAVINTAADTHLHHDASSTPPQASSTRDNTCKLSLHSFITAATSLSCDLRTSSSARTNCSTKCLVEYTTDKEAISDDYDKEPSVDKCAIIKEHPQPRLLAAPAPAARMLKGISIVSDGVVLPDKSDFTLANTSGITALSTIDSLLDKCNGVDGIPQSPPIILKSLHAGGNYKAHLLESSVSLRGSRIYIFCGFNWQEHCSYELHREMLKLWGKSVKPMPMQVYIICRCADVQLIPWPSFNMSNGCLASKLFYWIWKPPWQLLSFYHGPSCDWVLCPEAKLQLVVGTIIFTSRQAMSTLCSTSRMLSTQASRIFSTLGVLNSTAHSAWPSFILSEFWWSWKPPWFYLIWQIIIWKSVTVLIELLGSMICGVMSYGYAEFVATAGLISIVDFTYVQSSGRHMTAKFYRATVFSGHQIVISKEFIVLTPWLSCSPCFILKRTVAVLHFVVGLFSDSMLFLSKQMIPALGANVKLNTIAPIMGKIWPLLTVTSFRWIAIYFCAAEIAGVGAPIRMVVAALYFAEKYHVEQIKSVIMVPKPSNLDSVCSVTLVLQSSARHVSEPVSHWTVQKLALPLSLPPTVDKPQDNLCVQIFLPPKIDKLYDAVSTILVLSAYVKWFSSEFGSCSTTTDWCCSSSISRIEIFCIAAGSKSLIIWDSSSDCDSLLAGTLEHVLLQHPFKLVVVKQVWTVNLAGLISFCMSLRRD